MRPIYVFYTVTVAVLMALLVVVPAVSLLLYMHWVVSVCWLGLISSAYLLCAYHATYRMEADVIIVAIFLGDIIGAYSRLHPHRLPNTSKNGMVESGFVVAFPVGFMSAHRLPTHGVKVEFLLAGDFVKSHRVEADAPLHERVIGKDVPVVVILEMQITLDDNEQGLKTLFEKFDVLSKRDLTKRVWLDNYDVNGDDNRVEVGKYMEACLAQILKPNMVAPVDDKVSVALQDHVLQDLLTNNPEIERKLRMELANDTIFGKAGIIDNGWERYWEDRIEDRGFYDPERVGENGPAVSHLKFLFRHTFVQMDNPMAAPYREALNAQAERRKGEGIRDRLLAQMEGTQMSGRDARALEAIEQVENVTVVSTESVVDALATQMISPVNRQPQAAETPELTELGA